MERCGGRASQNRALLEWNFVRQTEDAALRHYDEFSITAIAMFSDHLGRGAKLFGASLATGALTAGHEIMDADAIPYRESPNLRTYFFDGPLNLPPNRKLSFFVVFLDPAIYTFADVPADFVITDDGDSVTLASTDSTVEPGREVAVISGGRGLRH